MSKDLAGRVREALDALSRALDEDERVALAAVEGPWSYDGNPSCVVVAADGRSLSASAWNCEPPQNAANAQHIARQDPAYTLARVAQARRHITAMRDILDSCEFWLHNDDRGTDPCAADIIRLLAESIGETP